MPDHLIEIIIIIWRMAFEGSCIWCGFLLQTDLSGLFIQIFYFDTLQ